jgi:guanylate kinase
MNIVIAISEVSGPGASSLAERVCELIDGVELAVPFTTRLPRSAEDDGFIFTSQDAFERMIAGDEFLEYVEVLGNYYGTPLRLLQETLDSGHDLLIKVDERGLAQVKQKLPDAVSVLVLPPSTGQGERETTPVANETLLYNHLQGASQVLNHDKFDHVIANDLLEASANHMVAIIRSERARRA